MRHEAHWPRRFSERRFATLPLLPFVLVAATGCSERTPELAEPEVSQTKQAACTSPLTINATPGNPGFDTDANGDGLPDGWNRGGVGTWELVSPGYDGKSVKLTTNNNNNIYMDDSVPGVIGTSPCGTPTMLLIRATVLTGGSLNLADIEVNTFTASGSILSGYAVNVLGHPGQFYTFTLLKALPAGAKSLRARIRARGTGYAEFDDLYVAATDGTAAGVHPVLKCVEPVSTGVFDALFGYVNNNSGPLDIPVGPQNTFSPLPQGRGQIEHFNPGAVDRAFAVRFDGNPLSWTMTGGTVTASSQSPVCSNAACPAPCANGEQCIDGACVTDCGDGVCADPETCRTCSDCGCETGLICIDDRCARPARCGIEWECGSGTTYGVARDCGACPNGLTCQGHTCR